MRTEIWLSGMGNKSCLQYGFSHIYTTQTFLTTSFQGAVIELLGLLGLLAEQPQVSVEVRLSLTNENERHVSCSHLHLVGVLSVRYSVRSVSEKFVKLYEPDAKSWSSTEELNNALNWTHLTSQTGGEYFQSNGVSQMLTNELIEGATRMNYAQVRQTAC